MPKNIILSIIFLGVTAFLPCRERIIRWDDNITVNHDATIDVEERITVKAEGIRFKHGIWRTFPTRYSDLIGLQYVTGFKINRVERDGSAEPYSVVNRINGKQIYIGDPHRRILPGVHTFLISYKTDRQLGFFKNHAEFYYNVVGNDVEVVVEKATARVKLPSEVPRNSITFEAYTGYFGSKGGSYSAKILEDGTIFFETTKPLLPHRAFTIVVAWPKGYVSEPSIYQEIFWFFRDNIAYLMLIVGILLLICFYLWAYRRTRRGRKDGVVIPLFYPPEGLCPGEMRYLIKKEYDALGLTSDIVDMAVKGFIAIEYKKNKLFKGVYSLTAKAEPNLSQDFAHYVRIFKVIKSRKSPLTLKRSLSTSKIVQLISNMAKNFYQNNINKFIKFYRSYSTMGIIISLIIFGISLLFSPVPPYIVGSYRLWVLFYAIICSRLYYYFYYKLPIYTVEGEKLYNKVEGFKLFLVTTEMERLKVVGTPPTKTPQLWEKYLPYAIALGVEEQWSAQFAPVFDRLEQEGCPYSPAWYLGPGQFRIFEADYLASGLRESLRTPGSTSGRGGSGGAGRGGGGGGAGGW